MIQHELSMRYHEGRTVDFPRVTRRRDPVFTSRRIIRRSARSRQDAGRLPPAKNIPKRNTPKYPDQDQKCIRGKYFSKFSPMQRDRHCETARDAFPYRLFRSKFTSTPVREQDHDHDRKQERTGRQTNNQRPGSKTRKKDQVKLARQ